MRNFLITLALTGIAVLSFSQGNEKLNVYFKFNDYKLDGISKSKIDSLLHTSAFVKFRIEAHCDSVGSNEYNDNLSMQRALSVKRFLAERHIDDSLVNIKWMGERSPLFNNTTEASRALNRCVELFAEKRRNSLPKKHVIQTGDSLLLVEKLEIGTNFRLQNINFEGGKHKLLESSIPALQQLLRTLKQYPALEIEIQGYICCENPGLDGLDFDTQTNDLSVNRARVVYDYLIKYGISPKRLSYQGFGANNKLVEERTEADRITNRRVEIKIIRK
ncbi:MAG: OmpA family protein [Bacteroidetes bacterium]|nr:OmpA family protein [Bacteroidota bacterium]